MSALISPILEGGAAAIMVNGFTRMQTLTISAIMTSQYGGHSQYLTLQGLAVSVLCMSLGFLSGILPGIPALKSAKRLTMMIAMPIEVVVSIIYWGLLTFAPSLIMPDFAEGTTPTSATPNAAYRLPISIDLALHAAPAVFLILDFFLFERKYTKREASVVAPAAASLFGLWYCTWVEHCGKNNNGVFPYPFLTESNFPGRIAIYIGAVSLALGAFRLINRLHN